MTTPGQLRRGYGPIYRRLFRCGEELTPWEKLVFANLLERLGQNHRAWPSQQLMAADLGVSARTVRAAVAGLRLKGFIRTSRRGLGQSLTYELDLDAILAWSEHSPLRHDVPLNAAPGA